METASLKSFSMWARTALIREVTARIAVVLAPASPERVEQPKVVAALEKAVEDAGGGDKGRSAVADRVAYTWFNRIIALRFMDANGYTGTGVVSPQAGIDVGQPEILAEAKRANIDPDVVSQKTRETVTGLLNGTRRSDDPQGEAYAQLLAEYCRHWNRSMPFIFERAGDFTELLIPANLLADDSVLNRAAKVLTAEVCQDVEVIGWLYQFYISERKDEVFAGFKENKKAGAAEIPAATQLFTPHWIVRYLVENSLGRLWMLNRPNSRLVDQMEYYIAPVDDETDFLKVSSPVELKVIDPACGSGHMLTRAFDLLYAIYEEEGYAQSEIPGLILANNLYGTEIDPRAGALAAFALTMKARARQRTFFNKTVEPSICVIEPVMFAPSELDLLIDADDDRAAEAEFWNQFAEAGTSGSLIQPPTPPTTAMSITGEGSEGQTDLILSDVTGRAKLVVRQVAILAADFHVVIANPPYMGSGHMDSRLSDFLQANYPHAKQDLYGAFVVRATQLAKRHGFIAMITGDTWTTIRTFSGLRAFLLSSTTFHSFLNLRDSAYHADTFGANAAFVLSNAHRRGARCAFIRLDALESEGKRQLLLDAIVDRAKAWRFEVQVDRFEEIPGKPFAYWLRDFGVFAHPTVGEFWSSAGRLKTHDGAQYIRYWWEVDSLSTRWHPLIKGGEYRPYFGNRVHVVDWSPHARSFYVANGGMPPEKARGRAGICWSKITSGTSSFRLKEPVEEFDSASPTLLPARADGLAAMLAYLNSAPALRILNALNPTLNTQIGDVLALPDLTHVAAVRDALGPHGDRMVALAKAEWSCRETAIEFDGTQLLGADRGSSLQAWHFARLARAEELRSAMSASNVEIDRIVEDAFARLSAGGETSEPRQPSEIPSNDNNDLNRNLPRLQATMADLVSFAVGCMFGRYSLDEPGLILADQGATLQDYLAKVPNPTFTPDADNVIPIVDGDWFEDDIVARFRQFLRVTFGEQHFEENLRFVTELLEVKDLRDYFVKSFYKDHVQRYKKRPIYWLFSSPKGSFNALIYMHRYTPSTASTVLNEYLREYKAKLGSSLQHHERLAAGGGTPRELAAAQKQADRLRKVLLELDEYEHDVLYPLASQQTEIDLDDGVKVNYSKFGAALKKIPGLELAE
jgi:Eco57I restriction-modification methylase